MRVLKQQCVSLGLLPGELWRCEDRGSAVGVVGCGVWVMLLWWGVGVDGMAVSVVLLLEHVFTSAAVCSQGASPRCGCLRPACFVPSVRSDVGGFCFL